LVCEFGELFGFPAGAALGEDARQQLRAGFVFKPLSLDGRGVGERVRVGGAAPLSPGPSPARGEGSRAGSPPLRGERTFHGGFEQGLAVLRQLFLRGFELGHAGIEVRQQLFELGDDAGLFGRWGELQWQSV